MTMNLLILGGTTQATAFARACADRGIQGTVSFAGRVDRPIRQPLPQRVGGFGGADGLAIYIKDNNVTQVIDATHPFASQMSINAIEGCRVAGVPLAAFTREKWSAIAGDNWTHVPDIAGAVDALNGPAQNVMLAVGRMHLADFAPNPQHHYLLRLVDPPKAELPLPNTHVVVDRGPFSEAADLLLMQLHKIQIVVSKNAGGTASYAKLAAARTLGLPVIMIDRPGIPDRTELFTTDAVFEWLNHSTTDRGV